VALDIDPRAPLPSIIEHCADRLAAARSGRTAAPQHPDGRVSAPAPRLLLNYLGRLDALASAARVCRVVAEDAGLPRRADEARFYDFDVVAYGLGGELHVEWRYSANRQPADRIHALVDRVVSALRGTWAAA
jgi:hypothetical protein